ncbi:MBL fold metallo-hydrolase [Chryseolinea lacunae]|uniref:MBL fold metallo-hydrolase n=1 Tax=Chryseolinea lacunae TaxID=2801331 RepID=A0ABS1KWE7_9BACT|nr:MBL fold metallo-hydrolase [Chryseolinea lacunae]MBL0743582.1 MBL fold metallo-hydrolase [Chryseolinea lacunae]
MDRRDFLRSATLLPGAALMAREASAKTDAMKIHFLRHATFLLEAGGVKILVDPMLSSKDAMDPVGNAATTERIPMVDLPLDDKALQSLLQDLDAVAVTHTHRDHWDARAKELIAKDLPLICQPSDTEAMAAAGFKNLLPVEQSITFKGLKIYRTGGQHGTGEIGAKMGKVSGFVVEHNKHRIYISGDTIWCTEVADALKEHRPDFIVVNAGAAQFLQGDPITMSGNDVVTVCQQEPNATVIAVHMNTVNHCLLKRSDLQKIVDEKKLTRQCLIPRDGEVLSLA